MFECRIQRDAFLGVVAQKLINQIPCLLGDESVVREGVGSVHSILENLGDGVVVEGQRAGEPAFSLTYIK